MNRTSLIVALPALLFAALGTATPHHSAADEFKLEEGYTLLFNGKDLTGWDLGYRPPRLMTPHIENLDGKTVSGDKSSAVEDGLLVVTGKGPYGRGLYARKDYNKDFHLKFEFRTENKKRNNSGIYIRSPQLELDATYVDGVTKVFKDIKNFKEGGWNEIDITVKAGAVASTVNGKALSAKDVLELTVKDGKPTAQLNGQPIAVDSLQCTGTAEAICKCNGELIGKPMKVPASGTIGLESEIGRFEFRRVRIKELP